MAESEMTPDIADSRPARDAGPNGSALPRAKLPLRVKLIALAVVLAAAPLLVFGYDSVTRTQRSVQAVQLLRLEARINEIAESVKAEYALFTYGLDLMAKILGDATLDLDARIAVAKSVAASNVALDHTGIYDDGGALVDIILVPTDTLRKRVHVDPARPPERLPDAVREAAAAAPPAMSRAELIAGTPRTLIAAPIRLGDVTWYVASYMSLHAVKERIESFRGEDVDAELEVFVVDDDKRVLVHQNTELSQSLASVADHEVLGRIHGATRETQTHARFRDARGRDMFGAAEVLGERLPWTVVAESPWSKAMAESERVKRRLVWIGAVILALAIGLAVLLAAQLTRPLGRLVAFAGDLAARRWDRRVEVGTRDELAVLGAVMNRAAQDLAAGEAEIRHQTEIRADLGRYLPAQLVDRIARRQQSLRLGGERRQITALFADVASFTPLSENHPAEEVVVILNQLFTILTEIVFRHGGTVDKFIGDCVMAFWGAPEDEPEHAGKAVAAAEDMMRWLEVGNASWQAQFGVTIHLAIGVNSGDAIVGNFGSETRMEYTAIGDAVNVAARLEGIARPQQILISQATMEAAGDDYEYLELGAYKLAGRMEAVNLFEVRV